MTKIAFAALPLLFLAAPADAQKQPDATVYVMPQIPDEDLKVDALKLAYKMNGYSMVGRGDSIDLTAPVAVSTTTVTPTAPVAVHTTTVTPAVAAEPARPLPVVGQSHGPRDSLAKLLTSRRLHQATKKTK